ncbi:hypothetical protein [Paraburkholderia gardini]|uniref:Uncharacterized protein n=1 Tax=Paraburkholderia gardini TaxID=2823469 RepID=A0ABM8U9S5_9BURK|nr:hypothetical protein [Paraburkholderia gardini]CAG4920323.1 hypothetical protein R54767_04702 [Paraburkholderia gardini]
MADPTQKTCPRCKASKPVSEFGKLKTRADGLSHYCKACSRAIFKAWYLRHREERLKKIAEWKAANPEKVREQQKKYHQKYYQRAKETA